MIDESETDNQKKERVRTQWRATNPQTLASYPHINDYLYTEAGAHMIDPELEDSELNEVVRPYLDKCLTK